MKWLLTVLLFLALLPRDSWATIALVQGPGASTGLCNGAATCARDTSSNVTAGNLITVAAFIFENTATDACVAGDLTKTAGTSTVGTIALASEEEIDYDAGTGILKACIWHVPVTGTGSLTMTVAGIASSYYGVAIDEWSASTGWNSTAASRLEDSDVGATATNDTSPAVTTAVTSANGALMIGVMAVTDDGASGALTVTPEAAWSQSFEEQDDTTNVVGSVIYRIVTAGTTDAAEWTISPANNGWSSTVAVFIENTPDGGGGVTLEQEGFRWGVDDGNEAAHTFEAAQDTNISIADNQSRLLRTLVNATNDPASAAYTLRYQKNGSGGYTAVPVGSTTPGSISNQLVAASSDDAQEQGGTVTLTGTTIGASLDATTEWAGMRFTNITIPVGATITSAAVGVVPSATTEDEPLVTVFMEAADDCAAFTTGASDISGRSRTTGVSWSSTDLTASGSSYHDTPSLVSDFQAVVNRGGWASGNDVCVLIQGGSTGTRDLTIEAQDLGPNTNPPRLSVAWTTPNQVYITTSANITAGGEATTARLTAPSGKSTSDFVTGRRWDDENGTDTIDITTDDYTELEPNVFIASSAADGDFFDFRYYAGSSPLDTYTVTPRWAIPSAGGSASIPKIMHNRRQRTLH